MSKQSKDECLELKNINYKTLLQTGNSLVNKDESKLTLNKIDELLNDEKNRCIANCSWPKLNSQQQLTKLNNFAIQYCKQLDKENLTSKLKDLLKTSKQHLQRTKDVVYDKKKQEITSIPRLEFKNGKFLLTKEKRQSTSKGLYKHKQNKTVKSAKPAKPAKPVKSVKSAQSVKPAKPAKPVKSAKSAQSVNQQNQ